MPSLDEYTALEESNMAKSFCVQCKKEVSNDTKKCECGCRTFIFGNVRVNEKGNLSCICGNESMKWAGHVDLTDKATTGYQCTVCGAGIGEEHYRDAREKRYWRG